MTTIRDIVADALRESGILTIGDTPTADSYAEGVRRLNVLVQSMMGVELGDPFVPMSVGKSDAPYTFGSNDDYLRCLKERAVYGSVRLNCNLEEPTTLYLDPNPREGARLSVIDIPGNFSVNKLTLNGNGRNIEGLPEVELDTDGLNRSWFYRADLGSWQVVTDLTENSDSPFPVDFDDWLTTMLAQRLNPRYGQSLAPETIASMQRVQKIFRARYRQEKWANPPLAISRLPSSDAFYRYGYFYPTQRGDYGTP